MNPQHPQNQYGNAPSPFGQPTDQFARPIPPRPPNPSGSGKGGAIALIVFGLAGLGVGGFAMNYGAGRSYVDTEALLHGSIIGGVGLLLFSAGLALLVNKIVATVFCFVVIGGAAFVVTSALDRQEDTEAEYDRLAAVADELMPFCEQGVALPDNAPYDGEPGYHPVTAFNRDSSGTWRSARGGFPEEWELPSAQEVELIGCIQTDELNLESCAYDASGGRSFYINRIQYIRTLSLFSAADRTALTSYSELGSEPGPCPESTSFSETEFSRDQPGTYPDSDAFVQHMEPWVMGTATQGPLPAGSEQPSSDAPK